MEKKAYQTEIPTTKPLEKASAHEVIAHLSNMLLKSYFNSQDKETWADAVSDMITYLLSEQKLKLDEIFSLLLQERSK